MDFKLQQAASSLIPNQGNAPGDKQQG